jgi:hypothetical protein
MGGDSEKHREIFLEGEALLLLRKCRCAAGERNYPEALLVTGTCYGHSRWSVHRRRPAS